MVSKQLGEKSLQTTNLMLDRVLDQREVQTELGIPESFTADPKLDPVNAIDEEILKRIRDLPPEIAVLLISVGCLGFIMPGMVGAPALVAGGLVLWPEKFSKIETWFETKFPKIHHQSMKQLGRFLNDLERRYPVRPDR